MTGKAHVVFTIEQFIITFSGNIRSIFLATYKTLTRLLSSYRK